MKRIIAILFIMMSLWGCAHSPATHQIHENVYAYDSVDEFVVWLKAQPGIKDVNVNKTSFS